MRRSLLLVIALLLHPLLGGEERADAAGDKAWDAARSAFARAMKKENPKKRVAAVKTLGRFGTEDAAKILVNRVLEKEKSGPVLAAAVSALTRHADDEAIAWLTKTALGGKWNVRAMILEALAGRAEPAVSFDAFLKASGDRDPRVRTMGLFGLGACKNEEALPILVEAISAKEWQVRVAAIEGLRTLGNDGALRPLALRLGVEKGRLRGDIADALQALTKKKFGLDAELWLRWLEAWENRKPGAEAEDVAAPEAKDGASSFAKDPTYYGIKIRSDKVVFVIDLSLSMKDPVESDKRRLMGESRARTPADGEKKPEKKGPRFEDTIKWWKIKCGLDLAKAQFVYAIGQLDRKQSFDIVTFSDEATAWQGKMIKATPMARASAANFIENLDVIGKTNSFAALELAFNLSGPGKSARDYRSGADTIFFLTDGAPSIGKYINPDEILGEIARMNKVRRIKINVIGLNVNVPFLRNLAKQNGGIYKTF